MYLVKLHQDFVLTKFSTTVYAVILHGASGEYLIRRLDNGEIIRRWPFPFELVGVLT